VASFFFRVLARADYDGRLVESPNGGFLKKSRPAARDFTTYLIVMEEGAW
jgi:hypothetical protein